MGSSSFSVEPLLVNGSRVDLEKSWNDMLMQYQ